MTEAVWQMIFEGIWETLYMTILSTVIAYIVGLPLGILLSVTGKGGILRNRAVNGILGAVVNILRSVPFLILLVVLIPFTRLLVGTSLGTTATIVPLTIGSIPIVARMVESSLQEVPPGTKFEDVLKLYQFDQELSVLIFSMISKIEVALRVRLVEALLIHGEPLVLQDSSIFKEKKLYWQNMSTVASEIARSNDVFIKHNFDNHDGEVPVWAAAEVLSFGTLSKIIKNLKTGAGSSYSILAANYQYKSKKGNLANPSQKMLASWIQGVSVLRNMCAHNSRIYNRTIHTTPEILDADKVTPPPVHNGLYQILLAMKYLRSSDEDWTVFVDVFDKLIQNNIGVVSLTAMNLPTDWKDQLSV